MHLILTGATGTIGSGVLAHCLASPLVSKLSILSRRTFTLPDGVNFNLKKANIIEHTNYNNYEQVVQQLNGAEACIWAQGISQTQVDKEYVCRNNFVRLCFRRNEIICHLGMYFVSNWCFREYIRITHDYPLAAAKAFANLSGKSKFNFIYVSGEG